MSTARRHESGFVLVGVIMFVLALTILGMSLFAISSFEGQFLGQSRDENGALYAAQGGLDMVREVLAVSPYTLASSHTVQGIDGVVYAVAWQRRPGNVIDSTGTIDFTSDSLVTVEVTTRVGGADRVVRASYRPAVLQNYYKRLFTITNTIQIDTHHPAFPLISDPSRTSLDGPIWQQSTADSTWITNSVGWTNRGGWIRRGQVPPPDVTSFMSAHAASVEASPTDTSGAATHPADIWVYHLAPAPATTAHYYGDVQITDPGWVPQHLFPQGLDIWLGGGIAVWMFPAGLYVDQLVNVYGTGTLVIVGGATPLNGQVGINFHGGLVAQSTANIVLVSDGAVWVRQENGYLTTAPLHHLSVYASSLRLLGPSSPSAAVVQACGYGSGMDDAIDALMDLDALPRPSAAVANSFRMVAGSWRDLTP